MGACCCKTEIQQPKSTQQDQTEQKSKQSSTEMHMPNINPNNDNINEIVNNDVTNDINEEIKSPTHWKTQTIQLLTAISADTMFDLGSDFEDYDDQQYHEFEPKQLINIPRKSYVAYTMTNVYEENVYDLQIGSTLNKAIEQKSDKTNINEKCVWKQCNASNFKLRSIEYCTNKKAKLCPSKNALYNVTAVDCFEIDDISAANMDLNKMISLLNIKHRERESIYPAMIIVSLMIPLFKKKQRNGLHLLLYASISSDIDYNDAAQPALLLLNKLINFDAFVMENFKMSAAIPNINATTLNSITKKLVKTINWKSMALKKHATYEYLDKDKKDIFIIKFNGFSLNKQIIKGLSTIRDHLETIDFEIAFHIGAKLKNILPERILLCVSMNKLKLNEFVTFDAFCANKEDEYNQNQKIKGHSKTATYVMDDGED